MSFDLTTTVIGHLDPHLAIALLDFVSGRGTYVVDDIRKAKIAVLQRTNMVDLEEDIHKEMGAVPDSIAERRASVLAQQTALKAKAQKAADFLVGDSHQAERQQLRDEGNFTRAYLTTLSGAKQITSEDLAALHGYARFQYDCGDYTFARDSLSVVLELTPAGARTGLGSNQPEDAALAELRLSSQWGLLASQIMTRKFDASVATIQALRESIEAASKRGAAPLRQLLQRTWLIHWSLFVYFNHESGRNLIVDALFNVGDVYLNTIQTTCPHILRYIAAAIITNRRRRTAAYSLVRVLQDEAHAFSDPVTEFMVELYVNFDFEAAQKKLNACKEVLQNDFFLTALVKEFEENGRVIIFDTYCRVHQKIEISMLAEKLGLGPAEAERWIVDLIRNARFDAKIDSANNTVVLVNHTGNAYQKIIEKTKSNQFRSFNIASNIGRLQRQKEAADADRLEAAAEAQLDLQADDLLDAASDSKSEVTVF